MSTGDPESGTGPQDNVPQEQVQTNPNWDTGGEKTPSQDQQDRHWDQVDDGNRDAGAGTPVTPNAVAEQESMVGGQDRNPSTYGGMGQGQPASGAMTNPDKTVDADDQT